MRALVITFLAVVALTTSAFAGKSKVAITKIAGDSGAEVQAALKEALADDFSVVPFKETSKAIKSLGLEDDMTDKDYAKLASELDADVVVHAKLEGKGDDRELKVRLYVKGKKSKKFSVQFGSAKSEKFKKKMHTTLVDKIGAISKSGEDEEEPKVTKKKKGEEVDEEEPKTTKKKKGEASEEEEALVTKKSMKKKKGAEEAEEEEEDDAPLPKAKKKKVARGEDDEEIEEEVEPGAMKGSAHAANRAAIRLDVGVSGASRVLDFNSRIYDEAPKDYKNSFVPGARVGVELYPLAFSDPKGRGAGLGLWGDFDKTIVLNIATLNAMGQAVQGKAVQQRYSVGGGYRFAFTKSETSPTFTIGMNYARRTWIADKASLQGVMIDTPDTDYKIVEPLAALRIPFSKSVALVAGGRGMLILEAGAITTGAQYGQAKVFGVEAGGGLDIVISNRFAVRISGEFSQIGYTFTKGAGAKANNRDGDPNTKDVFGAADRSIGGSATLGVLY